MPIWKVAPVAEQPQIVLWGWTIYEVQSEFEDEPTCHFVGYNVYDREGRTSTKIVEFDPTTKRGVTASGRVYELQGEPGYNSDADYTFRRWAEVNRATVLREVDIETL